MGKYSKNINRERELAITISSNVPYGDAQEIQSILRKDQEDGHLKVEEIRGERGYEGLISGLRIDSSRISHKPQLGF